MCRGVAKTHRFWLGRRPLARHDPTGFAGCWPGWCVFATPRRTLRPGGPVPDVTHGDFNGTDSHVRCFLEPTHLAIGLALHNGSQLGSGATKMGYIRQGCVPQSFRIPPISTIDARACRSVPNCDPLYKAHWVRFAGRSRWSGESAIADGWARRPLGSFRGAQSLERRYFDAIAPGRDMLRAKRNTPGSSSSGGAEGARESSHWGQATAEPGPWGTLPLCPRPLAGERGSWEVIAGVCLSGRL